MRSVAALAAVASLSVIGSSATAGGLLASHPDVTVDVNGFPARGSVTSSATDGTSMLDVTVDFAVFEANMFTAAFPGSGYSPSGPLVYAYQVFVNNPPSNIGLSTTFEVPADAAMDFVPGHFSISGGAVAPVGSFFGGSGGDTATWVYGNQIAPGSSSIGLAFSSENVPELAYNSFFGGGSVAGTAIVHAPSSTPFGVPEPGAAALLALSALLATPRRSR